MRRQFKPSTIPQPFMRGYSTMSLAAPALNFEAIIAFVQKNWPAVTAAAVVIATLILLKVWGLELFVRGLGWVFEICLLGV